MQSWWKRLNKRYNKTEKRIVSIILCCLLTFSGVGIAVKQAFASDKDPKIDVILQSATPNPAKPGQEIQVNYTVNPNDFTYAANTNNTQDKEVAFLIDKSQAMTEATNMKNGLTNDMVNALIKDTNIKVHFTTISYNDNVVVNEVDPNAKDNNGVAIDYRNAVQNSISTVLNAPNSTNNTRNLGQAIKKANDFFAGNKNPNSIKNIIIISEGEPTDQLPTIDKNKYNVITLAISNTTGYDNPYVNLKQWHTALGGSDDSYYISSATENHNDINSNTSISGSDKGMIIKRMCTKLEGINYKSYSFTNSKLYFSLGDNFDPVSGLTPIGDNSNRCTIDLPTINYSAVSQTGSQYIHKASPFQVSFKIKPKAGKVGELGFVQNTDVNNPNNYISYNKLNETEMTKEPIQTPIIKVQEKINILEIEPADSFKITLNSNSTSIKSGTETGINAQGKDITIDHISMPEFVGKVDKLNGKYDVVVIGRNVDNNLPGNQTKYKDYNIGDNNQKESDITDRKFKELRDFINTGQLVYVDKNVFDDNNSYGTKTITNTKLYKNFKGFTPIISTNYFKNKSISELQLDTILSDYSSIQDSYKRMNFSIDSAPVGDSRDAQNGSISNRKLNYNINIGNYTGNVTENLYLDVNGDGLFKDDEKVYTSGSTNDINRLKNISYTLASDFIGDLAWKVELVKDNGIKSYDTGTMYFKALDGQKQVIKVLQVAPYPEDGGKYNKDHPNLQRDLRDGNEYATGNSINTTNLSDTTNGKFIYSNLNLKTNPTFQRLLAGLKDYDIQIDVMSIYEFNLRAGNDNDTINRAVAPTFLNNGVGQSLVNDDTWKKWQGRGKLSLNGNYNMIIFGFSNAYSGLEDRVNQSFSTNAVNELKLFIQSRQSVMFTHDTMYYEGNWTNNATTAFRDWSGLSRYVYGNNTSQQDYDSTPIPHDTNSGSGSRNADGFSSNIVYKTNQSLITSYPFQIDNSLSVRTMHNQWFQLNFEDEDVVPWYTMTASDINQYDSRNNYYTFSRGNITYSGTAENSLENNDYPESELKLFVNTIAKAIRGANHAPTIDTRNLNDTVSNYQDKFDFQVIPNDLDNDKVNVAVKIERATTDSNGTPSWVDVRTDQFNNINSGTVLPISISQDIFNQNSYKYLRVTITAKDEHGADAATIQKQIEIINTPLLNVSLNDDKTGYLIGDDITLNATVKPSANITSSVSYSGINMSLVDYSNSGVINFQGNSTAYKFDNIDNQHLGTQTQSYNFNITNQSTASTDKAQLCNISANYNYVLNDGNSSNTITGNITKVVSVRKGQIIVSAKGIDANGNYDVNLGIAPKVQIKKSGTLIREDYINTADGKVIFDNMPSGQYDVYIDSIAGYEAVDNHKSIEINYDNNIGNVNFDLTSSVKNIQHGLYKNIDSGSLSVNGGQAELARGAIANLAVGCDIASSNVRIELRVNKNVDIISDSNPIKIYQIINGQLSEISGASYSKQGSGTDYNSYIINLPSGINSETKLVIRYQSEIPSDSNVAGPFTNKAIINGTESPFILNISSVPKPDLF